VSPVRGFRSLSRLARGQLPFFRRRADRRCLSEFFGIVFSWWVVEGHRGCGFVTLSLPPHPQLAAVSRLCRGPVCVTLLSDVLRADAVAFFEITELPYRQSLVHQLDNVLREERRSGRWSEWLPEERDLVRTYPVSRFTLRGAPDCLETTRPVVSFPDHLTAVAFHWSSMADGENQPFP
jgi:hypothetical protein